jgi:uncharacterized protein
MIELDHTFSNGKPTDYNWEAILDLDRIVPCVEGGKVLERTAPDSAKAEINVKMGAMGLRFTGTVTVTERDDDAHRAVLQVKSREDDGGGKVHTAAQISGKAASMGEGVVVTVLDALIKDFTGKLEAV